jgi:Tol biopolymer transport system component
VIYTINPGGSGKSKVTNTYVAGDPIDYSPNSKKFTYMSYEGFNDANPKRGPQKDYEIYTINTDGTGKFQLTNNHRYDGNSSYSPDGKRIAYSHWDGHDAEIYILNTDGTGQSRVTNNRTNEYGLSYSPDGQRIAYAGYDGKQWDIYTIGVNGKNRVRLTHNATYDSTPDYSPDGRRIAFAGIRSSGGSAIYTISARGGGGKTKVTEGGDDPDYSPDGKKIVYYTGSHLRNPDVYTINVGGGGKSKVAEGWTPSWGSRP